MKKKLPVVKLSYSIDAVLRKQNKLPNAAFLCNYIDKKINSDDVLRIAIFLREYIGRQDIPLAFYTTTLSMYQSERLYKDTWQRILRCIAAVAYTCETPPAYATTHWRGQLEYEWMPCRIDSITVARPPAEEPRYLLQCTALTTAMVDVDFSEAVSGRKLRYIAATAGFKFRNRDTYSYFAHYNQLAGMRVLFQIQKGSVWGLIRVGEISQHDPTVRHNQELMKKRFPKLRKCPCNCKVPCYRCGYGLELCEIATIPVTADNLEPLTIK
jgi:hypothetical protein